MPRHTWCLYLKQTVFSVRYGRKNYTIEADSLLRNVRYKAEEIVDLLIFIFGCTYCIAQYISNKMQIYTIYLYLETALHVSGVTSTHHQERIQLYLQHLVFVTLLLLPAAIVEDLELVSRYK